MNRNQFKTPYLAAVFLSLATALALPVQADPVPATAVTPGNRLVTTYSGFAGSPENSASLVQGLRSGTPITLTDPLVVGGPPPLSTTFTPPTRPMGYGNIRIALSLAEAQLASQGITNPSAAELQGALMGSTVVGPNGTTTTAGVLEMRASGMGWGQIANGMGYKLGPIISGKQTLVATNTAIVSNPGGSSVTTAVGAGASGVSTAKGKGVVTGTGAAADGGKGVTTAAGSSMAHGHASGITTGLGPASANAGGVVTAAGGKVGSNAGGNAGGNGKGSGKP